MDQITTQLDRLSELSDEEIVALQETISSEFETLDSAELTSQSVDAMSELADYLDAVRAEGARREVQAEELTARAAEAAARIKGANPEDVTEDVVDDEVIEDEEEEPVVASAETEVEAEVVAESEPEVAAEASIEEVATEAPVEEAAEAAVEEISEVETPVETEAAIEEPISEEVVAEETEAVEFSADEAAEAAAEVAVEAEASIEETTTIEPVEAQEEAQTVTAAAEEAFEAPADRRSEPQAPVATVAITAGADIPGVTAGSEIADMSGVAKAFAERLHTVRRANGGDGEQHTVAVFTTNYDDAHTLGTDAKANRAKIEAATDAQTTAITASGGFGTPLPVKYDIFGFGTDARPVKNALPKFQADRGGIRFVKPPVLADYAGAVGVWTEANDITAAGNDGSGDLFKNLLVVQGAVEQSAKVDAITLQLQVGNLLDRAYPELVARHNELALIQHARLAELTLLSKINAASTQVTTSGIIGFARDFLVNIKRSAAAYRSRHRIDPSTRLHAIIPTWVYDAMAADLTLNMPGDDNLGVTRSEIDSFLGTSNVSLVASLDQNTFGAQATGALLEFPDSFTWYLYSEGSFVFLDGGTLDVGIVRDSALVGTNDYRMFVETFEGLAFVGIESLAITSQIAVNGAAAALRDTTGGAIAAPSEY